MRIVYASTSGPGQRSQPGAKRPGPSPSRAPQRQGGPPKRPTKAADPAEAAAELPIPPANDAITVPEVRVIDENQKNLGVMPPAEGRALAVAKGLDLVLMSPNAKPPVCRIMSLPEHIRELKKQVAEARKAQRERKVKEMRLTARTDEHDLGNKCNRVVEFLRDGHPVKLTVSFTMSAWMKEEPSRREVFAKVVRRVGDSGAGYCDPTSITGAGPALVGTFNPTATPRPQADVEKTLVKLAQPIRPRTDDEREVNVAATAAAALGGTARAATIDTMLPPVEVLQRYRSPKLHNGRKPGEVPEDDVKLEKDTVAVDEDAGITLGRRRKQPRL